MLASQIIDAVRRDLNDTDGGNYRWGTSVLLRYLDDAVLRTYQLRPDLFLSDDLVIEKPVTGFTLNSTMILSESYREGLTGYVVSRALTEDSADSANVQSAAIHMSKFTMAMGSVPRTG